MDSDKSFQIIFQPLGVKEDCPAGSSILECAQKAGIDIVSLCGGAGVCGKCKVQIISGKASDVSDTEKDFISGEEIAAGYRLACRAFPDGNMTINVPAESLSAPQRVQIEGMETQVAAEPAVSTCNMKIEPPTLSDLRGDDRRLFDELKSQSGVNCEEISEYILRDFSESIRSGNWEFSASIRDSKLIHIGDYGSRPVGMAVDLGTTKIAGYLVDLDTGHTISSRGMMNPQISYGEDVIARMARAERSAGDAALMQGKAAEAVAVLAKEMCAETGGIATDDIREIVIAGNTAMHHLMLGLPVKQLSRAPHVPAVSRAVDINARLLDLPFAKGASAHFLPNIAGFVGGDHLAVLLAISAWEVKGPLLAVDIGTNTEMSLITDGSICSVSCASGPAFEGAHISCGMRAAPGAIDHVKISGNEIQYHTIQEKDPAGICGSGIFDVLAELFRNGIVDRSGRIMKHERVREGRKGREFIITGGKGSTGAITITQEDVRELQLAKAAIRSGIRIMLKDRNLKEEDIESVIVAGAFGTYIDIASAITIGMLPNLPLSRFRQVGNAAGTGAKIALISAPMRKKIREITPEIQYIELAAYPGFNKTFIESIELG